MVFSKRAKLILGIMLLVVLCATIMAQQGMFKRKVHQNTGLVAGGLNPCPDSPNCVGSLYAKDENHFMKPIAYQVSRAKMQQILLNLLKDKKQVEVLQVQENYIHSTFTVSIFKFIDDVEFYLPAEEKLIHFRSASRVGYSDLGANKRRLEKLKQEIEAALAP